MGLLGSVFEALFAGDDTAVPTVHATAVEHGGGSVGPVPESGTWRPPRDAPLLLRGFMRGVVAYGRLKTRRPPDAPSAPTAVAQLEFWFDPPKRARIDHTWTHDGVEEHLACVASGFRAKRQGPKQEAVYDLREGRRLARPGRSPSATDLMRHFWAPQLRRVVAQLHFSDVSEDVVAGRPVVRARARELPGGQLWPHWLIWNADEFDLAFDLEHGHLLSVAGYRKGRPVGSVEITTVNYGAPLDPAVFAVGENVA